MKKLTLIADVLLISLSAGLFLPNSTINMAKYQSDNNKSLITEKDNITPEQLIKKKQIIMQNYLEKMIHQ